MSSITQSGIYPDNSLFQQLFLVTQGSLAYTLVDKKRNYCVAFIFAAEIMILATYSSIPNLLAIDAALD